MKKDFKHLDNYRVILGEYATPLGAAHGMFRIPLRTAVVAVVSSGEFHDDVKWEHVSISTSHRCPTWEEMDAIKDMFWLETETVVQFHVPKSKHINKHPYCLHLWRYVEGHILPPAEYVG